MPVEIRELVIRTRVSDEPTATPAQASTSQASREELVAACVEKVMDLLKQQTER